MMLTVTEQEFDVLKARYQEWKDSDFIGADSLVIPILEMFNEIDGLVSIFSCSGHPESEKPDDDSMFFILAVKEGHQDMIHNLFWSINQEAIKADLFDIYDFSPFKLSVNYRPWPTNVDAMYYSWALSIGNITTPEKQQLAYEIYMRGCVMYKVYNARMHVNRAIKAAINKEG